MSDNPENAPPARNFCHATGLVYQSVGAVLALATCCWWPLTGWTESRLHSSDPQRTIPEIMCDAAPEQIWSMVAVSMSFVSGLALAVVGLGLQHDRRGAGWAAMVLTAVVGLFYWCYLGFAVFAFPAVGRIVVVATMSILWAAFFLLAGACVGELKRCPLPKRSEPTWTSRDEDDLRKSLSPRSPDKTSRSRRSGPRA